LALVMTSAACSHDVAGGFAETSGESSTTTSSTGTTTSDDTAAASNAASSSGAPAESDDGDAPKLDVGMVSGGPDLGKPDGCDKIDFLFVVDNSGSMAEEQASLVASFPGFIATIADTVAATDFHVMVVDTDEESLSFGSGFVCDGAGNCNCNPSPQCCYALCDGNGVVFNPPPATCGGVACGAYVLPTGCDIVLGAGKTTDQLYDDCGI